MFIWCFVMVVKKVVDGIMFGIFDVVIRLKIWDVVGLGLNFVGVDVFCFGSVFVRYEVGYGFFYSEFCIVRVGIIVLR